MSNLTFLFGKAKALLAVTMLMGFTVAQTAEANPDLQVKNFKLAGQVKYVGSEIHIPVVFAVINYGPTAATNTFINGIKVNGTFRWSRTMNYVAANGGIQGQSGTVKVSDPNKFLQGRTLNLVAFADAHITAPTKPLPNYARIQELNEYNNQAYLQVKVPGGLGYKAPVQAPQQQIQPQRVPSTRFPSRVPATRVPVKQIPTRQPEIRFPFRKPIPARQTSYPSQRNPNPTRRLADLQVPAIKFARHSDKIAYVVVKNMGGAPSAASKLQLTVRKINGTPVGRTTVALTHGLAPGQQHVVQVDTSSILPKSVKLSDTVFRVDADVTKIIPETNENNNQRWHNL